MKTITFESKWYLSELTARIFISLFLYCETGVSQHLVYRSLLVRGIDSRWSTPLNNHIKKRNSNFWHILEWKDFEVNSKKTKKNHVHVEFLNKCSNSEFFFYSSMTDSLKFKSRIYAYLLVSCSNFHTNRSIVSKCEISLWCFNVYLHWIYRLSFAELAE